jgi:hypothetical protein
MKQWDR